jgi:hypothetical protein
MNAMRRGRGVTRSRRAFALVAAAAALALALTSRAQDDEPASRTPPEHRRPADQTFLTYPEWFLVYSPREYAAHVRDGAPSEFPFLGHVGQLWDGYAAVTRAIPDESELNVGYHVMILVIATSTTVEYGIRAAYETVIGRLTEATRMGGPTDEERLGARVAQDYATFLDTRPWYQFDFLAALRDLWTDTSIVGPDPIRKLERRYALTSEYLAKAAYGWLIGLGTAAGYEPALETTAAVVRGLPHVLPRGVEQLEVLEVFGDGAVLITLPRYEPFGRHAAILAERGVTFEEIAGNRGAILVSLLAPAGWRTDHDVLFRQPVLTDPDTERVMISLPVASLSEALLAIPPSGARLEHVYDF